MKELPTGYPLRFGRVLKDPLPTGSMETAIWKDGIANIDEELNGVGSGYKRAYSLILFSAIMPRLSTSTKGWFVEDTRLAYLWILE